MAQSFKSLARSRTWRKDDFVISTDPSLFPISALSEVFNSEGFYWANAPTPEAMRELLENSLSFGLYQLNEQSKGPESSPASGTEATDHEKLEFVGIARCVTDFVTFSYLTDVWVQPGHQGKGLGRWLVGCVREVMDSMPFLRRSMLFTSSWDRSVPFYEDILGMSVIESRRGEGVAIMARKGRGHPMYGEEGL
ncbi:uncharacterized protein B0I36DRAFT_335862 [Microdochium trichocladiopsis]|uniref:N-acetyltransferase domain-containing protein n=1 Tax=Microdochium trichocladiopsis TaxID=1682393 RepID=A0A9P8XUZ4_9PEZI|nr:uncharacterized protein B0I36DRAFT_335862 [Microdochium trichocladiopsis]KAH7018385.1 hypothetical protein B0I36DRAFT_335862 [Microdochium trichocladiopsis]